MINFFMQFQDRPDMLSFVLQIFKRLYNSFPIFRKNLEDPIVSCLSSIVRHYKKTKDAVMQKIDEE